MSTATLFKKSLSLKFIITVLILYCAIFFIAYIIPSPLSKAILENIPMNQVLDLQKDGYTTQEAMSFFSVLGENGRSDYVRNLWTIDLITPFLSAIFFALLISYCTARMHFLHLGFRLLSIIPCVTAILDYTENILLTFAVSSYPQNSESLTGIADICTRLKWNSITLTIFLTLLLIVLLVFTSVFKTKKKQVTESNIENC